MVYKNLIIMFNKVTFRHDRKIFEFFPFRMFAVKGRIFLYIIKQGLQAAFHIFFCYTFHNLPLIHFF